MFSIICGSKNPPITPIPYLPIGSLGLVGSFGYKMEAGDTGSHRKLGRGQKRFLFIVYLLDLYFTFLTKGHPKNPIHLRLCSFFRFEIRGSDISSTLSQTCSMVHFYIDKVVSNHNRSHWNKMHGGCHVSAYRNKCMEAAIFSCSELTI